jgi:hypothetical protein
LDAKPGLFMNFDKLTEKRKGEPKRGRGRGGTSMPNPLKLHLSTQEKLWRKLKQKVTHLHRWSRDLPMLLQQIRAFLDAFAHDSPDLLRSVGLMLSGSFAKVHKKPWMPSFHDLTSDPQ